MDVLLARLREAFNGPAQRWIRAGAYRELSRIQIYGEIPLRVALERCRLTLRVFCGERTIKDRFLIRPQDAARDDIRRSRQRQHDRKSYT